MTEIKIGAGGWAYFNVPGDRLWRYSRAFDTVEVNSTFYEYPNLELVESWRRRTPRDFEFTVRCHRDLSHRHRLHPIKPAFHTYDRMTKICEILRAEILHIQTPPSLEFSSDQLIAMGEFFSSIDSNRIRIAWEIRSERRSPNEKVCELMKENNIIHCIDISKGEKPAYGNDILYTRLFGKGEHNIYQYTDDELRGINQNAEGHGTKKAILNFHTVRQYKDAARLKVYRRSGRFPKTTKSLGIRSLIEVLKEDAKFPTTKPDLVKDQGWKIFDWDEDKRLRVSEVIKKLPDGTYHSLHDLAKELHRLQEDKL